MKRKPMLSPAMRAVLTDIAVFLLCSLFFGFLLLAPLAQAEEALTSEEAALLAAYGRGEVVRLHILAASDSPQDQAVKLRVRDAVLASFGERLQTAGLRSPEEVWRLLQVETAAMETAARQCAESLGYRGEVRAEAGWLSLPEKRYGQVTLPAGTYRGLRIVLGAGEGHNWWCVLFPQLCLALAGDEPWTAPQDASLTAMDSSPSSDASTAVVWDSQAILSQWLLYPGNLDGSAAGQIAADIVNPKGNQCNEHAAQEQRGLSPSGIHP